MVSDDFESRVRIQLEILHGNLVREHRQALGVLEDRIAAEVSEKSLQQQTAKCEENTAAFPSGVWPPASPYCSEGAASANARRGSYCSEGTALVKAARAERAAFVDAARGLYCSEGTAFANAARGTDSSHLDSVLDSSTPHPPSVRRKGSGTTRWAAPQPPIRSGMRTSTLNSQPMSERDFKVLDIWLQLPVTRQTAMEARHSLATATNSNIDYIELETDLTERAWEAKVKWLMQSPSSRRYLFWEIMSFCCVAHDVIVIPLQVFRRGNTTLTMLTTWFLRLFWTLDIFISFITGYVTPEGHLQSRPTKVAWQYFHTWFFLDLVLVGCDWVDAIVTTVKGGSESSDAMVLGLLGMLRAIRLVRLVRMVKSQKISEFIFEHIRSEGVKLSTYMLAVILVLLSLVHVIACLWHGIRSRTEADVPDAEAEPFVEQYLLSFNHVLALFVGELVLEPRNLPERVFVTAVLIFAWVVSGAFVGSLTTAMTRLQIVASKRSTQFATLNRYLSDYGITRELSARVQRNARHALEEQKRHIPEERVELMPLISEHLRSEIHYEVCSPVLMVHPFFQLYNCVNQVGMRNICHTSVSQASLSRGDVLFSEAELAVVPTMFFIVSGRFVYMRGMESQQRVDARLWVAEAVLWTKWTHRGTLRALKECCVLGLDASRLASIMSIFPTCHGHKYAKRFLENLSQGNISLTDVPDSVEQVRNIAAEVFVGEDPLFKLPLEWTGGTSSRRSSIFSMRSSHSHLTSVMSIVPTDADGGPGAT